MGFLNKILRIKNKIEYDLDVKDFKSVQSFWEFITSKDKWYTKYSPYKIKNINKIISELEPLIVKSTNNLRKEMQFSNEEYWDIVIWDQIIVKNNLDEKSKFKSYCSGCMKEFDFTDRYPKSICADCKQKVTDKNGRKVEYFNTEALGYGCQGYYVGTEQKEKYESDLCYIDEKEYFAEEAYSGGIVIQLNN